MWVGVIELVRVCFRCRLIGCGCVIGVGSGLVLLGIVRLVGVLFIVLGYIGVILIKGCCIIVFSCLMMWLVVVLDMLFYR